MASDGDAPQLDSKVAAQAKAEAQFQQELAAELGAWLRALTRSDVLAAAACPIFVLPAAR